MAVRNGGKRIIDILDAVPKAHDFYRGSLLEWYEAEGSLHGPCIVSDKFSNEMGFCLKTTFPFLSSARGDTSLTLSGFAVQGVIECYRNPTMRLKMSNLNWSPPSLVSLKKL